VDARSSVSITRLKSVLCWLSWAYASRLKNWRLGSGACEWTYPGGKLSILELWALSLSLGGRGGVLGRGGVGSGFRCLGRSGGGATVPLPLQLVCGLIAALLAQGKHSTVWFWRSIARCYPIAAFTILCPGTSTLSFLSSWILALGFLIRYCVSSTAVCANPPVAIWAIFHAKCMSDCSNCSRPPCLAIVADMLKTYKGLVSAHKNDVRLLLQPYTLL